MVSVEFHAEHRQVLERAIDALGWTAKQIATGYIIDCKSVTPLEINLVTGQARVEQRQQSQLNQLKVAYSRQALKLAAKINGWQLQQKSNTTGHLIRSCL
jgi:hypothetical protein